MIRFVDLRGADIAGYRFAWWDTVLDRFVIRCNEQAWETWAEFEAVCYGDLERDRFLALAPDWVHKPPDD